MVVGRGVEGEVVGVEGGRFELRIAKCEWRIFNAEVRIQNAECWLMGGGILPTLRLAAYESLIQASGIFAY